MSADTQLKETKLAAQRIFYVEFCGTDVVVDSYDNDEVQRLLAVCVEAYSFIFHCSVQHPKDCRNKSKKNPPYLTTHRGVRNSFLDINKLKLVTTLQYILQSLKKPVKVSQISERLRQPLDHGQSH